HALHGRGLRALRRDRDHGPWPHHRAGHAAAAAQEALQRRHPGTAREHPRGTAQGPGMPQRRRASRDQHRRRDRNIARTARTRRAAERPAHPAAHARRPVPGTHRPRAARLKRATMKKFLAIFRARNREFLRDRSTVGWNIILPIVLVFGLGFIFSDTHRPMFKVGVVAAGDARDPFLETEYVQFIPVEDADRARQRVARHQLDMLLELGETKRYWINPDSPRGYVLERMLPAQGYVREEIEGREVRYVDWLVPGILGMNL